MPQNFSGQNLKGRSFKGQNLRGANFSYADIQGADFTGANLKEANFKGAKAGVQKHWVILQLISALILTLISGLTTIYTNLSIVSTLKYGWIVALITSLIIIGILTVLIRQGFTTTSFSAIAVLISVVAAIALIAEILIIFIRFT
ncbi:pentapeptide repeat-containing protein [Nostoc linckia FACHB-104]|nr:pentapeptide repeat-containing protein [Nostoc linckia FACHB-104]